MQVKASKKMAQELNKALKGLNCIDSIQCEHLSPNNYAALVDYDLFRNENDYNSTTGLFNVIKVNYKSDFYAMPQYLTTIDLIKLFRASDKSFNCFVSMVKNAVEI